jgi:hypothetical protein
MLTALRPEEPMHRPFGTFRRLYRLRLFLLGFVSAVCGVAQGVAPPGATLELPVLVVDHQHRPVDDVQLGQLKVKAGAGAVFAPTALRKEGDDPIALAILIDASRDSWHDLHEIDGDVADLAGSELLPEDRVTVYAVDCTMTRSLRAAVPDAAVLRKAVADAMSYPNLHGGKQSSACGKTVHLWDDAAAAIAALSQEPGRRVLLLITSGADGGSKYDAETVRQFAFDKGVAIFALRDQRQAEADNYEPGSLSTQRGSGSGSTMTPEVASRNANSLELLCANDGGVALMSMPLFRKGGLAEILLLVRSRLILTIPRDAWQPGSSHAVKVSGAGLSPYFMSATGPLEPLTAN